MTNYYMYIFSPYLESRDITQDHMKDVSFKLMYGFKILQLSFGFRI